LPESAFSLALTSKPFWAQNCNAESAYEADDAVASCGRRFELIAPALVEDRRHRDWIGVAADGVNQGTGARLCQASRDDIGAAAARNRRERGTLWSGGVDHAPCPTVQGLQDLSLVIF
jgi:hypothetical protein